MKNAFYFQHINTIGGVETFFYELAKKYKDWDITVYYKTGDEKQIRRLQRYVPVYRLDGIVECEKVFFNYQLNIESFKAKEYYQIIHADLKTQGIRPNIDERLTGYIGVSQTVCDAFEELTGIKATLCYNPLTFEEEKKPLFLCSATRLTSEKGGKRMKALAERLDREGIPYYWMIFTNSPHEIASPNVIYREPTLDIRKWIASCDFFVQLSDSEGWCYSVNEKLASCHGHVIHTPCPSFNEMKIVNGIRMEYDLSNMDDVIRQIKKEITLPSKDFAYTVREDIWDRLLAPGKSNYERNIMKVKATSLFRENRVYPAELDRTIPDEGFIFEMTKERFEHLSALGYVTAVEELKEEKPVTEKPKAEKKTRKSVKKK